MKAFVFTQDKLSYEVLSRSLQATGFTSCEQLAPKNEVARRLDGDQYGVVFLDFDMPECSDLVLNLPPEQLTVYFGGHKARQKAPQSVLNNFMLKPFTREQVDVLIKRVLLTDTKLSAHPNFKKSNPAAAGSLKNHITSIMQAVQSRRAELMGLLTATPEQLRALLVQKSNIDFSDGASDEPAIPEGVFPVQSALIIDSDPAFARLVARYLVKKCILEVDIVAEGKEAWKRLQSRPYDIVILQWEASGLNGLAIYNRMRTTKTTRHTPILVTSSQLKAHDFRLLDEDFAVSLIEKSLDEKAFSDSFTMVLCDAFVCKENQAELLDMICKSFEQGTWESDRLPWTSGQSDKLLLNALRLAGDLFVRRQAHDLAETAYAAAWDLGDRRLSLLTGYAKACHLNGRHHLAQKLLSTANVLAPQNIERLCLLGEVDLCLHQPEAARERFLAASAIDKGSRKAGAGLLISNAIIARNKAAVQSGEDLPEQQEAIPGNKMGGQFSSYLNLIGIDLSRSGKTAQAAQYYKAAMIFIHNSDDLVKIWFNLGLCYLRGKQKAEADKAFQQAYTVSGGKFTRVQKYLKTEEDAAEQADDLTLFERF